MSVLLHAVCGGRCGAGVVVYYQSHEDGMGLVHAHAVHSDPHGAGVCRHSHGAVDQDREGEEPGEPDHVHLCRGGPDATQPRGPDSVPPMDLTVVAVVVLSQDAGLVSEGVARPERLARWCAGPPPCVRISRLLI